MADWLKRIFGGRKVYQKEKKAEKNAKVPASIGTDLPQGVSSQNWRAYVSKMASPIKVGGFRPTGNLLASVFGDVRVSRENEEWPVFEGMLLWPLCQFNLQDAPLVPEELSDIKFLTIFVHPDIVTNLPDVIDTADIQTQKPMVIRAYNSLANLVEIDRPKTQTHLKPFEVQWLEPQLDYPNHDTLPFNFDILGIGDYYEQSDVENIQATKLGGCPGTIQSEPWWDYKKNDHDFKFVMQIETEPKANWGWGDGAAYLARSTKNPALWALEVQFS